ncbi:MAG: 3'-5' exonuclease [Verrucomicrobia bacterium]|nr:MAG: 3'-5' exonuclease [Verrucomicrobiota bacterium]TAE88414.1 MAG: 3'-5' exonuclease [Verrucomicrobiota bacterium]TAF26867.1 MAG: 3'-5' exonuclease [Verrucomicrobiota bacterium]TAF42125.1 MAG: 3'-5' exonuclease [Verrucomicrobiota bacterium]
MKIECPNDTCKRGLSGLKSDIGKQVACPACGHAFIWTDRFYRGDSFVIYDLETTGLYPDEDEFIQLAAVRFEGGRLIPEDGFSSFARPRRRISSFIESYTGIGNHHVAGAPRPEEVLCRFSQWAGDSTLIAHNGLRFDSKFLAATCRRHGLATRPVDCIDSIHISKMLFGKARGTGHSLDHVKARLGLRDTTLRRHDARGDVDLLGRALLAMSDRLGLDTHLNAVPRHPSLLPQV